LYTRTTYHCGMLDTVVAVRRVDKKLQEVGDQSKLVIKNADRVHYALGLLGVPEDFERLDLEGENLENQCMAMVMHNNL